MMTQAQDAPGEHAEHAHEHPLQTISITIDPNHGTISYRYEHMSPDETVRWLEYVKLLVFAQVQKELADKAAQAPATTAEEHTHAD